jgi:hypothetical protein
MSTDYKTLRRLTGGCTPQEVIFVTEYIKDFDERRAATIAGYEPDTGYSLKEKVRIKNLVASSVEKRLEYSVLDVDAEWVLKRAVENYYLALQKGNVTASNTVLGLIGKLTQVDAFAADKTVVSTDNEVMARLVRGRKRLVDNTAEDGEEGEEGEEGEVNFM